MRGEACRGPGGGRLLAMRRRIVGSWTAGFSVAAAVCAALSLVLAARAGGDERGRKALPTVRQDSLRNFELKDVDGKPRSLSDLRAAKVVVLAWTEPGCPVAMVYAP